jgi:hypothetical protein
MLSREFRRSKTEMEIKKGKQDDVSKKVVMKKKNNISVCQYANSDAVGSPPNQFIEHLKQRMAYYDGTR